MFIFNILIYVLLLLNSANAKANNKVKGYIFVVDSQDVALRSLVNCKENSCDTVNIEEVQKENFESNEYSKNLNIYSNINRVFYLKFKNAINCFEAKCNIFLLSNLSQQNDITKVINKDYANINNINAYEISPYQEHDLLFKNLIRSKNLNIKKAIILDIKDNSLYFTVIDEKTSTFQVNNQDAFNNIYSRVKNSIVSTKILNFQNIFKISNEVISDLELDKIYTFYSLKNFVKDKKISIIINNEKVNKYFVNELKSNKLNRTEIINRISLEYMELHKLKGDTKEMEEKLKELSSMIYVYSLVKFFKSEFINLYSNHDLRMILMR